MALLHHVALGAEDVRLVADFYVRAFDLVAFREHHYEDGRLRSIWLRTGETILMIEHSANERGDTVASEAAPDAGQAPSKGLFLLAFSVTESEKHAAEQKLLALGAAVESRTACSVYARDPEGNRVAISHFPFE